jgi:hypothetical protein
MAGAGPAFIGADILGAAGSAGAVVPDGMVGATADHDTLAGRASDGPVLAGPVLEGRVSDDPAESRASDDRDDPVVAGTPADARMADAQAAIVNIGG